MNTRLPSILLLALCMSAAGAQQVINVGAAANDRTGNGLRTAFIKTNNNFTELYAAVAAVEAGSTNGLTITTTTGTLTIANLKTLTVSNTLTLAGTDGSTLNIGTGGTLGTAAFTAASAYQPVNANLTVIGGLGDPNADRLLFWDDSAGAYAYLTAGSGLTISGTTISATGVGSGDVSAASNFGTDNVLIRSDGVTKGVQASGITISDGNNVSGVVNLTMTGDLAVGGNLDVGTLSANTLDATTFKIGSVTVTATAAQLNALAGTQSGVHATPSTANPLSPTWDGAMHTVWYGATGTINLPAAAGYTGRGILIYNTGAFTITIDSNGSEVIIRDGTVQTGGVSMTLSSGAGNFVALISDGARWITLGFKGTLSAGS